MHFIYLHTFIFVLTYTPVGYIIINKGVMCMNDIEKKKERTIEEKKNLKIRINKIIGQLNGVSNMIDEGRYCDDILIQLSAIDKSVKALANIVLDNHMHTCLINHIKNDEYEIIDDIINLVKRFQ